nr:hypothetical protein Itr_chr14CG19290 [Ipomoea trifida]
MAMGDGISPTKSSTASCEAIFRQNLLRGILCIEMAPRESFPANGRNSSSIDSLSHSTLWLPFWTLLKIELASWSLDEVGDGEWWPRVHHYSPMICNFSGQFGWSSVRIFGWPTPVWMFLWCFDYPGDCSSLMVFQIFQCSHTLSFTSGGDFLVGGSGSIESGEGRPRLVFPTAASGLFFLSPASVFNTYIWV